MQKVSKEAEWIAQDMKTWAYYDREELEKRDMEVQHMRDMVAVARKLLGENVPVDIIARCTELTIEEVQEIQSEM